MALLGLPDWFIKNLVMYMGVQTLYVLMRVCRYFRGLSRSAMVHRQLEDPGHIARSYCKHTDYLAVCTMCILMPDHQLICRHDAFLQYPVTTQALAQIPLIRVLEQTNTVFSELRTRNVKGYLLGDVIALSQTAHCASRRTKVERRAKKFRKGLLRNLIEPADCPVVVERYTYSNMTYASGISAAACESQFKDYVPGPCDPGYIRWLLFQHLDVNLPLTTAAGSAWRYQQVTRALIFWGVPLPLENKQCDIYVTSGFGTLENVIDSTCFLHWAEKYTALHTRAHISREFGPHWKTQQVQNIWLRNAILVRYRPTQTWPWL